MTRFCGLVYGVIIIGLAFAAQNIGSVYVAGYVVTGAATGGLCSMFLMALFFPFVEKIGVLVGAMSGFLVTLAISVMSLAFKTGDQVSLPVSTDECPESLVAIGNNMTGTVTMNELESFGSENWQVDDWPWKVSKLSYLLYPITASLVGVTVGITVSLAIHRFANSGRLKRKRPCARWVHPLVRTCFLGWLKVGKSCRNDFCECCRMNKNYRDRSGVALENVNQSNIST